MRGQEVDADVILECRRLLIDKARELYPQNAEVIISHIAANEPIEDIRRYSDDEVKSLIIDVARMQEIALLPVQQSPLWGDGSQNGQLQSQFHPRGSFHGFQPALIPTCEIGTLHHGQLQFHPPSHPIGPIGAFQNPCSKLIGFEDHFQSLSIPGDVMQSNYQSDSRNVDGYPSNYKVQTEHSCSHSSLGNCTNGENCRFSHVSNYTETNNMRQVGHLVSLQMLDMEITLQILEREIRDLLLSQPSSSVPVDHLEKKYLERYEKPLDFEGFQTEGQMNRKVDCSLTDLLMQLNTIKVIERQGHHFVVLVNDDPKYLTHGSESVMPPARTDSDQIYITFKANKSTTETDIQSYFSKYGTVSEVRLPSKQRRMFGFVRFLDPGTARRIISERGPHFICGNEIRVKPYKERDELKISEEKDDHSNCIVCKVSNVDVIGEHHTVIMRLNRRVCQLVWIEHQQIKARDNLQLPESRQPWNMTTETERK